MLGAFLILILGVVGVAIVGAAVAPSVIRSQCSLASLKPVSIGTNSFVAARDNSLLGTIPAKKNRQQLTLAQMSPWLPKATVAIEDRRFWKHGALDYAGIARAAVTDIESGRTVQGASTLTQQLARNLYIGRPSQTIGRKVKEACLAMRLSEQRCRSGRSSPQYLNVVYYGNQAYGVAAAAQTYFSRRASQLTVAQAAMIAGLPQAPTAYDPFRDPDAALARRNEVLDAMFAESRAHAAGLALGAAAAARPRPGTLYKTIHEPYFFGYVDAAARRAVTASSSSRAAACGCGRRSIRACSASRSRRSRSTCRRRAIPASALVAIDPRNGKVRAMAVYVPSGERLQFNLASQGHRQAGSAFKPFTLASALEHGHSLYSYFSGPSEMTIPDPRCEDGYGEPWTCTTTPTRPRGR